MFQFKCLSTVATFLLIILLVVIQPSWGQWLRECATEENFASRTCCPIPTGYTEACGGLGRGVCAFVTPSPEGVYQPDLYVYQFDERPKWPSAFWDYGCRCEMPFSGQDCSECAFGYYGDECAVQKQLVRHNIEDISTTKKERFFTYMNWAKGNTSEFVVSNRLYRAMYDEDGHFQSHYVDVSVYDYFIWIHYYANMKAKHNNVSAALMFNHHSSNFLFWHRIFLLKFERALQKLSGDWDFSVPYWNWAGMNENCTVCTDEYFGANDLNGVLSTSPWFNTWPRVCGDSVGYDATDYDICDPGVPQGQLIRLPGQASEKALPTREDVALTLSVPNYDTPHYDVYSDCSFRNVLGGNGYPFNGQSVFEKYGRRFMHGQVHRFLGGVMNDIPSSFSDPIFIGHHGYLDRLIEKWLRRWNSTVDLYPISGTNIGHNRYAYQVPWFPVLTNADSFQSSYKFGYDFDDVDEYGMSPDDMEIDAKSYAECFNELPTHYYD